MLPRQVTPRERRVSRNEILLVFRVLQQVTPRERRVSRNSSIVVGRLSLVCHASREACE